MEKAEAWLEPEQVHELRNACYSEEFATYLQKRNEAIVALLYDAGLRVTELVDLDVDHLRFDEKALYLPPDVQKDYQPDDSPSPVTIDLAVDTLRVLKGYLNHRWKDVDALFPSRKADRVTPQSVRHMLKKVARAADVRPQKRDGS